MQNHIQKHIEEVFSHLYINPLEKCNLSCKICYTKKTNPVLKSNEILRFIERFHKHHQLKVITFCGGEVFLLNNFPKLVNKLIKDDLFVQIITNGTIDRLDKITNPNSVNLIVSIDGLKPYHDANRGKGNYGKSIEFIKKAHQLQFHTEIFSVVTRENYRQIGEFEKKLAQELEFIPQITYHPRKPLDYLKYHPFSNILGEVKKFNFLTNREMREILKDKKVFPPKTLGCYQIALMSDGQVYGCCEGTVPLGTKDDKISDLMKKLKKRIMIWEKANTLKNCLGCSQPEFTCGIKQYL